LSNERGDLRIIVVDDHPLWRAALTAAVSAHGIHVVAESADPVHALAEIERLKPDVAVLDIQFEGHDGIALVRKLAGAMPTCRVLMLTAWTAYSTEAMEAGAHGYVLKTEPPEAIVEAIRTVARGGKHVSNALAHAQSDPLAHLSPREREVFRLAVDGLSTENIARRLSIAAKTVESHRASINRKLNVHSSAELVRFAATNGLLRYDTTER
jgi:DNA-binding NarL/FixJ family response regulator